MIHSIKTKALVYAGLVHVGFIISLIALFREDGFTVGRATFDLLLLGACLMYSAFLFSALSIWIPLRPWLSRYQRARVWRTWIVQELPTILALIPVIITALQILKAAWNEIKDYKAKGELNVKNLATVAQKFADQAEGLSRDPVVETVKNHIKEVV